MSSITDVHLTGIVTGTFRKLTKGDQSILTIDGVVRSTHGLSSRAQRNVAAVLSRPHGWDELSGRSWLPAPP